MRKEIRCVICHSDINNLNEIFQLSHKLGIICQNCVKIFSSEDIEIMSYLFFIYGGYFGKFDQKTFSLPEAIKCLTRKDFNSKKQIMIEDLNERLIHKALLHGISPVDLVKTLKSFLNK
ncbi:MAG: hypothetical protein ACFE8M_09790 [Candidatus Hermodarchaeota archaeon]